MKAPFTREQFLEVFKNYNETIFPAQLIFYALSAAAVYLLIRPTVNSDKIISSILAFFWMWMGIVYHYVFFTAINKAAYLFGSMFILQGILFLIFGVFHNKLSFKLSLDIYGISGIVLILFSLIVYPAMGYYLGHVYPASPTFGLPCPTTIFIFGLLLLTDKRSPVSIMIIPFIWSVIGFTAVFNFGIFEDTALLVAGLMTLSMLLIRKRKNKQI